MPTPRDVYYISGSTAILAKDMGKALLSQFPDLLFSEEYIPFISNEEEARKAFKKIMRQSGGNHPLIFSSLFSHHLNSIFDHPSVHLFTIFDRFLEQLERVLATKALRRPRVSRIQDDASLSSRVSGIDYTIRHDDGAGASDYCSAELIIIGISRSGKTPVSMFLATQFGIKTANYPLVEDDLATCHLKAEVRRNRDKLVGLSISPEILHKFREKRFPGSRYAEPANCQRETMQALEIFQKYSIPMVWSGGSSIEETAIQIMQVSGMKKYSGSVNDLIY